MAHIEKKKKHVDYKIQNLRPNLWPIWKRKKNNKSVFQSQNRLQIQDLLSIYKSQLNNVLRKFQSQNWSRILNFATEKSVANVNKKKFEICDWNIDLKSWNLRLKNRSQIKNLHVKKIFKFATKKSVANLHFCDWKIGRKFKNFKLKKSWNLQPIVNKKKNLKFATKKFVAKLKPSC